MSVDDKRSTTTTEKTAAPDPRELSRAEMAAYLRSRGTVSVPFAGACCGISRAASYASAKDGSMRTLRLGSRLLVPTSWLEAQLGLESSEPAPRGAEPE